MVDGSQELRVLKEPSDGAVETARPDREIARPTGRSAYWGAGGCVSLAELERTSW